ncbi:MAG: flagellar hook-associated protein FlgK [Lachnospiraceae bacterium]|nr:flagellar hook-associated protein FlgK [Lachnospiraceae bacterium]
MPSTFFGLNIAYTGLQAANAWLNTTGNNISNVETKGYSRQQVTQQAADALRLNTSYGMAGAGVTAVSVDQIRNGYYDLKYWNSNSILGIYEERNDYMRQIEDYFNETDTMRGFNTIFSEVFSSLDEVYKSAGDDTVKTQFLGEAQSLCNYFKEMSTNLRKLQEDANAEIKNKADAINTLGSQIATLNKQINLIECNRVVANELRDKRSLLIDELSKIVDVEVEETPIYTGEGGKAEGAEKSGMNNYVVRIAGGQILVDRYSYNELECVARENKVNQSDAEGLFDLKWKNGLDFNLYGRNLSGELKGLIEIRDGNNAENFKGNIVNTSTSSVTVDIDPELQPYLTDINKCTLPETGAIRLGNKMFEYTSWSAEMTKDPTTGKVTKAEYTFNLKENPSDSDYKDKQASVGTSVDYQGIPYYQEQMNEWIRDFARAMNDIEKTAKDKDGNHAEALLVAKHATDEGYYDFTTGTLPEYLSKNDPTQKATTYYSYGDNYYQLTAMTAIVNPTMVRDVNQFMTYENWSDGQDSQDICEQLLTVRTDKSRMSFRGCTAQEFLQTITADIALNAGAAATFEQNQTDINNAISNQRQSVMGVDNDEEALNLVKFREAFNLAAKMMSVMQEIYDKLINGTGM